MVSTTVELFYNPSSAPSRAVLMTIKALDLTVDYRKIDMHQKIEHKQLWFIKMNPQHTVPTIDDGGFVLWESRAIMSYLVSKYGQDDSLYPKDVTQRAIVDRLLYFDIGCLYKSSLDYFGPVIMGHGPLEPSKGNALKQSLEYLDQFLSQGSYVAGNTLTIADLSLLASVTNLEAFGFGYKAYANVYKWVEKLKSELPYYKECNEEGIQMLKERLAVQCI